MYTLYLLRHANAQMHMCLIVSSLPQLPMYTNYIVLHKVIVWRKTLVVGKFGELSAKLPLAK